MPGDWPTVAVGELIHSMQYAGESSTESDADESSPIIPVEANVSLVKQFSDDHPATFEIGFTNRGKVEIVVEFGTTPPFNRYGGRSEAGNVLNLVPDEANPGHLDSDELVPSEPEDGTWRVQRPFFAPDLSYLKYLEPGETVSDSYLLLAPALRDDSEYGEGPPNVETGVVSGEYAFSQTYQYGSNGSHKIDVPELDHRFVWEFLITVE